MVRSLCIISTDAIENEDSQRHQGDKDAAHIDGVAERRLAQLVSSSCVVFMRCLQS